MFVIVGLGNPGEKYAHTRHNVGFDVVNILSQKCDIPIKKIRCHALIGEGVVGGQKTALVLPQTFMNLSGQCVSEVLSWYKISPEECLVISDDIDLPSGTMRIRPHGGAGSHNGWKSIIQLTGSDRFPRIRVGTGTPPPGWDLADWVLSHYPDEETRKIMFDAYLLAAEAAECLVEKGIDTAMNRYNVKKNAE